jgi:hypothetical protein
MGRKRKRAIDLTGSPEVMADVIDLTGSPEVEAPKVEAPKVKATKVGEFTVATTELRFSDEELREGGWYEAFFSTIGREKEIDLRGGDRTDFLYPKVLLMRSKDNTIFIRKTGYISENTHSFMNSMYFLNSLPPDGCEEKAHKASPNELVNITRIAVAHEECCDMS